MGLMKDIDDTLVGKLSKLGEINAAVRENLDVIYVRDNELLEVATILSGEPFAGVFYNIDSEKYMLWNFEDNGFKEFVFDTYAAIYYQEDFEGGVIPAMWTTVNGGENDWHVGTAAQSTGTYGLYISNDGGVSNAYTSVGASLDVSHIYVDILLPNAANNIFLMFDWRCEGEIGFDATQVFNCPTTFTPTANVEVVDGVDGDRIGQLQYNDQSVWTSETIELPLGQANTTRRFVFSWRNDSTVENNPPMGLDNVKIIFA